MQPGATATADADTGPARAFKERVEAIFGAPLLHRSALNIRDGAGVFESILGSGRYKTVLEIGTYRGITAAFMAQFCERVVTIDLRHGRMERHGEVFDRDAFWASLGIKNISLQLIEGDAEKADVIAACAFDFAFIDGDHQAPAPARDFEMVRRCGAVLFHDYGADNGVTQFVDTLPKGEVTVMDIFALWRAGHG